MKLAQEKIVVSSLMEQINQWFLIFISKRVNNVDIFQV